MPLRLAFAFITLAMLAGVGLITTIAMDGPKPLRPSFGLFWIIGSIFAFLTKHDSRTNPLLPLSESNRRSERGLLERGG